MKVEGGIEIGASEHYLRIDDERPTFTSYFGSDIPFREIVENSGSKWHADSPFLIKLMEQGLGKESLVESSLGRIQET